MAAVAIVVQALSAAGLEPVETVANALGHKFLNLQDGNIIKVVNGDAAPTTVTLVTGQTAGGLAIADPTVVVPAGETWLISGFNRSIYNDAQGYCEFQLSNITSVTVSVLQAS